MKILTVFGTCPEAIMINRDAPGANSSTGLQTQVKDLLPREQKL